MSTRTYVENSGYDPKVLFEKIFFKDIIYLKKMKDLWKNRKAPKELSYDEIFSGAGKFEDNSDSSSNGTESNFVIRDQKKWDIYECLEAFRESLDTLKKRLAEKLVIEWDKDDDAALDFVTSVSNFRSYCFGIDRKSKFEVKSLAGNIIPAISTTNTIVGGFVILETIRLLSSLLPERVWKNADVDTTKLDAEKLKAEAATIKKNTFWGYILNKKANSSRTKVAIEWSNKPNQSCLVCSSDIKEIVVALPLSKTTLGSFVKQVVKDKFKTIAPDISVLGTSIMLWADDEDEEEDGDDEAREKILSSYPFMKDGVTLSLRDLEQNFEVRMLVKDVEFDPEENDGLTFKVFNQSELDDIITDAKNSTTVETNGKAGPSTVAEPSASSSNASAAPSVITVDEDEFVCLEDEQQQLAAARPSMVEPNDDDFEIIEMSELEGMETRKSTTKRPIGGDDLIILDDEGTNNNGNNTEQNGNSESNQTPTKRIRTN